MVRYNIVLVIDNRERRQLSHSTATFSFYINVILLIDDVLLNRFMWFMFKVTFGEHDRCERHHRPETRWVTKIIAHNFTMTLLTNDISLLKLNEPVTYSHVIRPVCLPRYPGKAENIHKHAAYSMG